MEESVIKKIKLCNAPNVIKKKAKMPKKEGNSESKKIQPRLTFNYQNVKIAGWIALILIAFFIVFSVLESGVLFPKSWSWEYRQISNARLGLVGQHICNYFQYDKVYSIQEIKNLYYSIDCMRISNFQFQMKDFQVWKNDVENLNVTILK